MSFSLKRLHIHTQISPNISCLYTFKYTFACEEFQEKKPEHECARMRREHTHNQVIVHFCATSSCMKSYRSILEEHSGLMSCPSKIFSLARTGKHPADKEKKRREK